MKKLFSLFLAIMILLSAIGCASYKTKPHVSGTVLEVNEKDILIDLSEEFRKASVFLTSSSSSEGGKNYKSNSYFSIDRVYC